VDEENYRRKVNMKVTCDECNIEMGRKDTDDRFISKYQCSKCEKVVTVNWSEEGYDMIEEYPK